MGHCMSPLGKSTYLFDTLTIVGPGLIGASMGLAVKGAGLARRIIGVGRRETSLNRALSRGAIDIGTLDLRYAVSEADLVVLAVPVQTIETVMPAVAESIRRSAILTEVSSVKRAVMEMVRRHLPPSVNFVPTHPMAGSEQRGPDAAAAGMFRNCVCIFTPPEGTDAGAIKRLETLWRSIGARVRTMSPEAHDRVVALVSHVPHLVASGMIEMLEDEALQYSGTGLIDLTRIASGDPDLWVDICMHNRQAVIEAMDRLIAVMGEVRAMMAESDSDGLKRVLAESKERRDRLLSTRDNGLFLNDQSGT